MLSFQDLFAALGFLTKPSKAQHPAKEHVVQGVNFSISTDGVTLSPTAARKEKIQAHTPGRRTRWPGRQTHSPTASPRR